MSSENQQRFGRLRNVIGTTTQLASAWTAAKTSSLEYKAHTLQERLDSPDSWVESAGGSVDVDFTDRSVRISKKKLRKQLKQYHKIRLDGGIVSALLEARALMVFGVGGQYTSEQDAAAEWLNDQFDALDLLTFDIGADATYYGFSLGEVRETQANDFGKLELIQPWTTVPDLSKTGEINRWEQQVTFQGKKDTQTFDTDEIWHFNILKSSGRDPLGVSLLGRGMSEVEHYRQNQQAIQNGVRLHGFPKWHIKLGREDGAVIDDNELRRAKPKFDNINELTKWVTGRDVDIDTISPETFDFENLTEHDLSKLAIAFMLPVEITQIGGGDGLGTGFPARLRERMFLLSARSQQNQLGGQLVRFGKHLLREYSSFDETLIEDLDVRFDWNEPITDLEELQTKVNAVGSDMTVNERREVFGMPPVDDDSIGEDFESPGDAGGGEEGLFSEPNDKTEPSVDIPADIAAALNACRYGFEHIVWTDDDHDLQSQPTYATGADVEAFIKRGGEDLLNEAAANIRWDLTDDVQPGNLKSLFVNKLSQPQGWSVNSLSNALRENFGPLDGPSHRKNIARTQGASLLNEAKKISLERLQEGIDEDLLWFWDGPQDDETTDACVELKERTNPNFGGQPRPRPEFEELLSDVRSDHFPDFESRGDAIHWQERHAIEAILPQELESGPTGAVGGMATAVADD